MIQNRSMLIPLGLGVGFALIAVAPVLLAWSTAAVGAACGEAPASLWRLWSHQGGANNIGFPAAAVAFDPVSPFMTLLFAVFTPVTGSAIAAWNTLVVLGFVALSVGSIGLARRLAPEGHLLTHLTFVFAVVGSASWTPLVHQAGIDFLPMMLVPGVLALVHAWLEPKCSPWVGACALILFVCACLGHWMSSLFTIAMTIPMAMVITRHWEGAQARNRTLIALVPGGICGAFHVFYSAPVHPGLVIPAATLAPAWVTQTEGALVLPATAAVALPSLGILMLALAGVAARPRDTVGWLLTAAWGILLAAGTKPESAKSFLPAPHMAELFPPLASLHSWWAIAPLVSIPMGIAAMRGVATLHKVQREKLAMGVLLIAVVDQTIPQANPPTSQQISGHLGTETLTTLSNIRSGAVLQLPGQGNDCAQQNTHRLWQTLHGRPASTAPPHGHDGGIRVSYLARLALRPEDFRQAEAAAEAPLHTDAYLCVQSDLHTLQQLGFAAILLDNRTGEFEVTANMIRQVLGPSLSNDKGIHVWAIDDGITGQPPDPCPLPLLPT